MTTVEQQRTRNGDYIDVAGVRTYYENADESSGAIAEPLAGNAGEEAAEEHCAGARRSKAAGGSEPPWLDGVHAGVAPTRARPPSIARDQIPGVACACRRWTTASEPPRPSSIRPSRPPAPMPASAQSMPPSAGAGSGTFTIITFGAV